MTMQALGMIETVGLPAAIAAADAAMKAANVRMLGYDLATGGLVTVKLRGDVGAVQAAVQAGAQVGAQVGQIVSTHVIPRPHSDLETMATQLVRGPAVMPLPEAAAVKPHRSHRKKTTAPPEPAAETEPVTELEPEGAAVAEAPLPVVVAQDVIVDEAGDLTFDAEAVTEEGISTAGVCNLCGDPACPRRKGQPHRLCMHWES